ncbi:MAG: hypothetical protein EOO52_05165 [Gammaproteobacteria bacterium]|nr:MAG: hypothetical protein EOO52_05165 [Gammaproteobacteria bacterium]
MKKQLVTPINICNVLLTTMLTFHAYAGEIVAKSYDISNVNEVIVHGGGRLEVVQSDSESLRVEADKEVIERVVIDQSGSKLTMSIKNSGSGFNIFHWFGNNQDEAKYVLRLKNLHYLGMYGASHATIGNWVGNELDVKASGASDITFANLKLQAFYVDLSGASNSRVQQLIVDKANFQLSGAANADVKAVSQAKQLKVGASGASNFRGKLLKVAQATVDASGASNIDVDATEFLDAEASGASNIHYLGQPQLKSNASGASHINKINN